MTVMLSEVTGLWANEVATAVSILYHSRAIVPAIKDPVKARKMREVDSGFSSGLAAVSVSLEGTGVLMVSIQFETVTILT